jgi:hypothetical protein
MTKYVLSADSAIRPETAKRLFGTEVKTEHRGTTVFTEQAVRDPFALRMQVTVKTALAPQPRAETKTKA